MLDIDKIMSDIQDLLPSSCELDDVMWNNEQTMMRTRIYKYGNEKLDRPPFANILPIPKSAEKRVIKYFDNNNLEYEFGQDYEGFPTVRIWEKEEIEDVFESLKNANGSQATKDDIIDAVCYMKGVTYSQAKKAIDSGVYTEKEIQKALLYWATEGLPASEKQEFANQLYKEFGIVDEDLSGNKWTKFYQDELQKTYYVYKDPEGNELGGYYLVDTDDSGNYQTYLKKKPGGKQFQSSKDAAKWVETHVDKKAVKESRRKKNSAGFFSTLYPGDPEKNAEIFNNSTDDTATFSEISESFTDGDWVYLSDIIEGMVDNMSDDDIDNDLRIFKRIAQKLQVRNMDDIVVVIDPDGEFDPQYYVTEVGQKVGPIYKNNNDIVEYEIFGVHMIAENHSGQMFLYFRDSSSAKKYMEAIEKLNESISTSKLNESKESSQRTNLINKIKSFGKNYNFEKYTDQQLWRIANRLQDAKDIEDVMKEFAEKRNQVEPDKEYDSDYDIPDETYVEEALTVREKLGRLDEQCLDNGRYLDLRNLYEAVSPTMTPEEKEELRKVVNATNDPDIISSYLNGKYKEKDESLQEDFESNLSRKLKWAVGDFLEFCEAVEWAFPEGLIFDGWKDWIDDNAMSLAEESVESADILLDEYKHLYEVNKGLQDHEVDDWETDTFLELYENMRSAYDAAIEEWEKNHAGE